MALSALAGNHKLKEQLQPRLVGGLGHAYIVEGPQGSGKHTLAGILSRAMVCSGSGARPCGCCSDCKKALAGIHPDIISVVPEEAGRPIRVDQVRQLRADAYIRPNEAARKVYILDPAQALNDNAQNALLKLLEDGPAYAAFLLLTENAGSLLTTVRSRCEELTLSPVSVDEARRWLEERYPSKPRSEREQAAVGCAGLLGRAVTLLSGKGKGERELDELARQVAEEWLAGDEVALMARIIAKDQPKKWDRHRFALFAERLRLELSGRLADHPDRRRVLRAIELVRQVQQALLYNTNPGQLAGWFCAQAGRP